MRILTLTGAAFVLATQLAAQNSLLFTGRFPFVSLDAINERPGGAITQLEEFDFSLVTPAAGASARTLMPTTGHQAYVGDANGDGNYTEFFGLKTYFEQLQVAGVFVKHADKAFTTWDRVWFTVRDNVGQDIVAFIAGGTGTVALRPGDFVRFAGNGDLEYFITQDQLDTAAGLAPAGQSTTKGASAICQDAAGNLYYSPPTGGQWVNGNQGGPYFANDGSIVMIDAASITYDAATGNVVSVAPNSAHLLWEEINGGPGTAPVGIRQMVTNSGASDRTGGPIQVAGIFGKISGLDLDPAGTTNQAAFPDASGNFPTVPDFVFTSDAGSYAGTIFSTAGNGTVATINGVVCGSTTPGIAADGSWLGVQLDLANFQPSLMGLAVVDALPYQPLTLDMNDFGALGQTQANWDIDLHGTPGMLTFIIAQLGPSAPGSYPTSVPAAFVPVSFTADSHPQIFVAAPPSTLGFVVPDQNGYGTLSFGNPSSPAIVGLTLMLQAAGMATPLIQASNPLLMQLK
jgi:hypothetical protein